MRELSRLLAATAFVLSGCGGGSDAASPLTAASAPTPVQPPSAPAATPLPDVLTLQVPAHVDAGVAATLTSSAGAGVTGLRYTWDFGDGRTATTAQVPPQTYTRDGVYEVKLTVTNEAGAARTASAQLLVGQLGSVGSNLGCTKASERGWCHRSASVKDLVFVNATTGWAAADGGAVYKTTDGGTTWRTQSTGRNLEPVQLQFADANVGWMIANDPAVPGGVLNADNLTLSGTTDGGATWTTRSLPPDGILAGSSSLLFVDSQRVVVSGFGGLRITRDGGVSWTTFRFPAPASDISLRGVVTVAPGGQIWVVSSTGSLLALDEVGTGIAREVRLEGQVKSIAFADARNGWVHAVAPIGSGPAQSNLIYSTTDGGITWNSNNATGLLDNGTVVFSRITFYGTTGWLSVVPIEAPFSSFPARHYRSIDGGRTWRQLALGGSRVVNAISEVAASLDDSITFDGGTTWQTFPSSRAFVVPSIGRVFIANADKSWSRVIGAGPQEPVFSSMGPSILTGDSLDASHWFAYRVLEDSSRSVQASTDAGLTWSATGDIPALTSVPATTPARLQYVNPTTAWLLHGVDLFTTNDAAKTWALVGTPNIAGQSFAAQSGELQKDFDIRNDTLLLTTTYGPLMPTGVPNTQDAFPAVWRRVQNSAGGAFDTAVTLPFKPRSVRWASDDVAVIVGDGGAIVRSADGGRTWSSVASGVTVNLSKLLFSGGSTGWIIGTGGTLLKTIDGGLTWQSIRVPASATLNDIHFLDTRNGYAVGESGTVLATTDGGLTWGLQPIGTVQGLVSVRVTAPGVAHILGRYGHAFATTTGGY